MPRPAIIKSVIYNQATTGLKSAIVQIRIKMYPSGLMDSELITLLKEEKKKTTASLSGAHGLFRRVQTELQPLLNPMARYELREQMQQPYPSQRFLSGAKTVGWVTNILKYLSFQPSW